MSDEPVMTPISPEEGGALPPKVSPFGAASAAPAPNPPAASASAAPAAAPAAAGSGTSTIKLKPVIRKPMIHKPVIGGAKPPLPTPAAAPAAAKKATQNLKSVTGPIPAQATLRKTGIIAEGIITPQQQQAAKSKTSRISLESAIGVAPVKETPAPMKTIRLRRPTDLKPAPSAAVGQSQEPTPVDTQATTVVRPAVQMPAPEAPEASAAESTGESTTATQKKTLKLHRPGGVGIKRPTMGIGKPQDPSATEASTVVAGNADVKDISSVAELNPISPVAMSETGGGATVAGVPGWVAVLSLVTTLAALLVAGVVVWYLWQEGVGPSAGANEMQFIQM